MNGNPSYRWENLGASSLPAEESDSGLPVLLASPCWGFPSSLPRPAPAPPHSSLLPLLGWEGLLSWRMQAGSHRTIPRSERHPGPGGELNSELQWEVRKGRLFEPARRGREAPLLGLPMDQMQNRRLRSVQAPVPAACRAAGPREERCLPRRSSLACLLAPTPGFMVLPLNGSL